LTPAHPSTLLPEETEDTKWFTKRFNKLRLLQYENGATLLAILEETGQGEKSNIEKTIVPVSQRTAVISAAHTKCKAHLGITKSAEKIADKFMWEKMREDIKKIILHWAVYLDRRNRRSKG